MDFCRLDGSLRLILVALIWCIIGAAYSGCETGSSHDAAAPDMSVAHDDGLESTPDSVVVTLGEACADGACAEGRCVHGVCSQRCEKDADCSEDDLICGQRGGMMLCSQVCDLNRTCPEGLVCADAGDAKGMCVAPGQAPANAPCTRASDCESWFCAQGFCLGRCEQGICMDGYRCLDLYAHDICTPVGGLEEGQACQNSQQCNSGICRGALCTRECPDGECSNDSVCIQNESINLCERRCADGSDCPVHSACLVSGAIASARHWVILMLRTLFSPSPMCNRLLPRPHLCGALWTE